MMIVNHIFLISVNSPIPDWTGRIFKLYLLKLFPYLERKFQKNLLNCYQKSEKYLLIITHVM